MSEQKFTMHLIGTVVIVVMFVTAVLTDVALFSANSCSGQTILSITPKLTSSHYLVVLPNATAKPTINDKAVQTNNHNTDLQLHKI